MPARYSRHYYDVFKMAKASIVDSSLRHIDLLPRIVEFKERFYKVAWSNLASARPGSFRLVPPPARIPDLERDYQAMGSMFFHADPSFDVVLESLGELESRINTMAGIE